MTSIPVDANGLPVLGSPEWFITGRSDGNYGRTEFVSPTEVLDAADRAEAAADRVDLGDLDAAVAATAANALATAADRVQTGLDRTAAETAAGTSVQAATEASTARDAALLSRGIFASTTAGLSNGVAAITVTNAGTSGTDGMFALAFSGGAGTGAAGTFTVSGGAIVSVNITHPGTGYTSAPTPDFTASSGLSGVTATVAMAPRNPVGTYFSVPGAGNDSLILYQVDAGPVATEVARYPSASFTADLRDDLDEVRAPIAKYIGASETVPLFTDASGRLLLGVDKNTGDLKGANIGGEGVDRRLGESGQARYTGSGPVWPLMTDASGRVVLGYHADTGEIVGALSNAGGGASSFPVEALADPIDLAAYNHLIFYGQSLSVGAAAGSLISIAQPYSNVTFNGGPRAWDGSAFDFSAFKPLVEDEVSPAPDGGSNRKETPCSGAANYASTLLALDGIAPASHVILASTAGHGGYRIDQLNKGSAWYPNLIAHVTGAQALNTDHAVHALCWMQGENDVNVTNYATYRDALAQLQVDAQADAQAETGQAHPVYFLTYQVSFGAALNSDIARAQLDLAQKSDRFFLATPMYHFPYSDGVHLTAVGYKWVGSYFGRAYAEIVQGRKPRWLNPVSATRRGAEIRVRMQVPTLPLVLDTTTLAPTADYGFRVTDGGVTATISNITVNGPDVVITLASAPTGAVVVRYALDHLGSGLTITNGASGNLRDSTPDTITISGTSRPLYHVAPAFSMTAIALGE